MTTGRKRPRLGDLIEIRIPSGLAYAQYVLRHTDPPVYGALIRVFHRTFSHRPENISSVLEDRERFLCFFPLGAAVNRGIVEIVGSAAIPERFNIFPTFKAPRNMDPRSGKVHDWCIWDGEKSWRVDDLTDEQIDLPLKEIINDTLLVRRIESGWAPRDEVN